MIKNRAPGTRVPGMKRILRRRLIAKKTPPQYGSLLINGFPAGNPGIRQDVATRIQTPAEKQYAHVS
jgi:hypothetical protein